MSGINPTVGSKRGFDSANLVDANVVQATKKASFPSANESNSLTNQGGGEIEIIENGEPEATTSSSSSSSSRASLLLFRGTSRGFIVEESARG